MMNKAKWILSVLVCMFTIGVGFTNCAEENDFVSADSANANSLAAEHLLGLLDDAKETEAMLNEEGSPAAVAQANEIRQYIDIIEEMIDIEGGGLSISAPAVLDARDYLLNAHLSGRDMLIRFDLDSAIAELKAKDEELSQMIADLESKFDLAIQDLETRMMNELSLTQIEIEQKITEIQNNFNTFKTIVENKFVQIDGEIVNINNVTNVLTQRIEQVNNNITIIQNDITIIEGASESAVKALEEALKNLEVDLKSQIVEIQEQQNQMKEDLMKQQQAFNDFIQEQTQLAEMQGKMCQLDAQGEVVSGQTVCGADVSALDGDDEVLESNAINGTCCMTAENLDCDILFPGDSESATLANQQCNSFLVTLLNRNDQIKELAENDEQQKKDIEALVARVNSIEETVAGLSEEVKALAEETASIKSDLSKIDERLLIVEFKASRAEAAATLNEMSELYMAWITRRKSDVRKAFCHRNAHKAYQRSDYGAAKQNWAYCHERLRWLNQSQELVNLAKAYTAGLQSINVDKPCGVSIGGTPAGHLTMTELDNYQTSQEVIQRCTSGKILVKALLLNVVKLHNKIGPDFRTAEYMAKKAKIGQLIYFGKEVYQASSSAIQAFENVDPTSSELKETPYGKIERVFKRRYVETRLRTSNGAYPEDASQFKPNIAGFNHVYSHEQINAASSAYMKRVKTLELEGACGGDCGFKVIGRNKVRRIGKRYSFPIDAKTQCPVHNDVVMVPSKDGKHYAYRVSYSRYRGAWENLKPYWAWRGNHYPIANSDADVAVGKFRRCGYRVRHSVHRFGIPDSKLRGRLALRYGRPYAKTHGLPQCMRFHFTCRLWEGTDGQGEWIAPSQNSNILHYLSGFSEQRVTNLCKQSGAAYVANTRAMLEDEKKTIRYYKSEQDHGSKAMAQRVTASTTQLTDQYWMLQDAEISYGVGNEKTSKATPFYGKSASHGEPFFRQLYRLTDYANIDVQQCHDPVVLSSNE